VRAAARVGDDVGLPQRGLAEVAEHLDGAGFQAELDRVLLLRLHEPFVGHRALGGGSRLCSGVARTAIAPSPPRRDTTEETTLVLSSSRARAELIDDATRSVPVSIRVALF